MEYEEGCECVEVEWSPIPNPSCPLHSEVEGYMFCNNIKSFICLHGWPQCNDPDPNIMCEECDCWKHEAE